MKSTNRLIGATLAALVADQRGLRLRAGLAAVARAQTGTAR